MGKLIDEVAAAIGLRHFPDCGQRKHAAEAEYYARAVLNEMFEETKVVHWHKEHGITDKWYSDKCYIPQSCGDRQTILVPRAKPEPTLAEIVKEMLARNSTPGGVGIGPDDRLITMTRGEAERLGAALAREEGK